MTQQLIQSLETGHNENLDEVIEDGRRAVLQIIIGIVEGNDIGVSTEY